MENEKRFSVVSLLTGMEVFGFEKGLDCFLTVFDDFYYINHF